MGGGGIFSLGGGPKWRVGIFSLGCLSVSLSLSLSLSLCLSVSLTLCLSVCLSLCLSVSLSAPPPDENLVKTYWKPDRNLLEWGVPNHVQTLPTGPLHLF